MRPHGVKVPSTLRGSSDSRKRPRLLPQLRGPRHREIPEQPLVSDVPNTSRAWLASWEPLVHLVEESPGHFSTKGDIYNLLKTKPHRDNATS